MPSYSATCVECGLSRKNYKPMSNADRIRAMSDEEIAEIFKKLCCPFCFDDDYVGKCGQKGGCHDCWLDWLKQEVE